MIRGTETRLEGSTLVVRIPMRFQRRGGRKRIVAPDARIRLSDGRQVLLPVMPRAGCLGLTASSHAGAVASTWPRGDVAGLPGDNLK